MLGRFYTEKGKQQMGTSLSVVNHDFKVTNCDTDSISCCKPDMAPFTDEESKLLLEELNKVSPEFMLWEDDGYYPVFIVLKSKNYIMVDSKGKKTIKGSALKSSTMEPILKQMLQEITEAMIEDKIDTVKDIVIKYYNMADNIQDIAPWCSKKMLSPTTYNSTRKNEMDIVDAVRGTEYKSGDRVYLYTCSKTVETGEIYKVGARKGQPKTKKVKVLKIKEHYNYDHDVEHYKNRVVSVASRFEPILGKDFFRL